MPIHLYIDQYFQHHPEERITGVTVKNPPIEKRPKIAKIEEALVSFHTKEIPIRIYIPNEDKNHPLMIFFHGGEYISGGIESHDVSCRLISSLSGYKVIAVDYAITSTSTFDTVLKDCYSVTQWIIEHQDKLGFTHQIAIGGPSFGALIATSIAFQCLASSTYRFNKQILYFPIIDLSKRIKDSDFQSRQLFNGKYGIDLTISQLINGQNLTFFKNKELLGQMPDTLIFTAEYDPLCDEGEWYAEQLMQVGVNVRHLQFDGNIHGFMQGFPGSPDYMRGYEVTTEFLVDG